MSEKISGYLLLIFGLVIILFSAYSIYQAFTGQAAISPLLNMSDITLQLGQLVPGQTAKADLLSGKDLSLMTNLSFYYLLMTFLLNVGFKVSTLGIKLIGAKSHS